MNNKNGKQEKYPEIWINQENSWDNASDEVIWFIYDFFKYCLNGYEKLIFYSYYFNGYTLKEISSCSNCSLQYIGITIKKIEKKLHNRWVTKKYWRNPNGSGK